MAEIERLMKLGFEVVTKVNEGRAVLSGKGKEAVIVDLERGDDGFMHIWLVTYVDRNGYPTNTKLDTALRNLRSRKACTVGGDA